MELPTSTYKPAPVITPQTFTPTVLTSSSANNNLNTIKTQTSDINTGIQNQATKVATDTAAKTAADAQAKATADAQKNIQAQIDQKQQELTIKQQALTEANKTEQTAPTVGTKLTEENARSLFGNDFSGLHSNGDGTFTPDQTALDRIKPKNPTTITQSAQSENDQISADRLTAAKKLNDDTASILNGTIPLSDSENAMVTEMKRSFEKMISDQETINKTAEGTAQISGARMGGMEYDTNFQAKTISSIVSAGAAKITDLNIKMASAVSQLTQAIKNDKIAQIKSAYDTYNTAAKDRQDYLTKTVEAVQKQIKDAADQKYKAEQDAITNDLKINEANLANEKFTWEQKNDIAKNAIEQGKLNLETWKAQQAANTDTLFSMASPVAKLPDGTYDTSTQQALFAQMSPADAALVKAVGEYSMDIAKITSLRSDERQKLAQKVALVYPGFEMQNYATIAKYKANLANTTQGSAGGAINSANKVINHLTSYIDNVSKLGNLPIGTGIGSSINSLKNSLLGIALPSKQEAMAEANTDATGVKDELAKFFKGSGVADVHTIDDWSKTVDVNASPAAQIGAVQGAIELLQGQLVPMIDQYKQTMGEEPPEGLFLKKETVTKLSELKNKGFKIDIPGVYYTDKSAWEQYGGGSQQQLDTAYKQLKDAGIATTPENILQAAQLQ